MTVGVLAVQGCVDPHVRMFEKLGQKCIKVRSKEDLALIDRIVLPGGESTTMLTLLARTGLEEPLKAFGKTNPVWGICAGSILIAKRVSHPEQRSFDLIDIHAIRNFYGSQLDSFSAILEVSPLNATLQVDFIRAPKLVPMSKEVSILAHHNNDTVLLRQGHILASSFHTELGEDTKLHGYFLSL